MRDIQIDALDYDSAMNSALYPSHDLQPLPHLWNAPSLAEGDLSEFDDDSDIMGQRIKLEDEFDLDSSLHGERPLSRTLCTPDLPHESDAQIKPEVLSSNGKENLTLINYVFC